MFNPEMMANMQKMMAENPGMMQNAMEMMRKNPGMVAEAQKRMAENPDMMRNAMDAMKANPAKSKPQLQLVEPVGTLMEQVQRAKNEGNSDFKAGQYANATDAYRKALERLCLIERNEETTKLQIDCHNNLAACNIKLKEYKEGLRECQKVLALDASNFKALLRRGQALMGLEQYERAESSLKQAVDLQSGDSMAQTELQKVQQALADGISETQLPNEEQFTKAQGEKEEGNTLFKAKNYEKSIKAYEAALDDLYCLPLETEVKTAWQPQALALINTCHLNIAACYLNSNQCRRVVLHCSVILSQDPQHKKALFRRAQAYRQLGNLYFALDDLNKALTLAGEPAREAIQAELTQVQDQIDKSKTPVNSSGDANVGSQIGQQLASMPEDQLKSMTDMMANMDPAQLEMMAKLNPAMKDATPEQLAAMRERMKNLTPDEIKQAARTVGQGQGGQKPAISAEDMKKATEKMNNMNASDFANLKSSLSTMTPAMLKAAAPQYAHMSDAQLQAMLDETRNASPDDLKRMADQMKSMKPDELAAAFQGSSLPPPSPSSSSSDMPALVSPSSAPAMPNMTPEMMRDLNAARASGNPMAAMTPELMKMSLDMMANMTPETLQQMTEMMGSMGGAEGQSEEMKAAASMMRNMNPDQFKQMQEQMKQMKPEDLEKLMNYAQKVQKATAPCMKVCKPVWTLVGPCVRRTIPTIQAVNRAMGGQLLGMSICLGVVAIYLKFLA